MDLYIFKILKVPRYSLSKIEAEELERKIKSSGNNQYLTSIIDFNLSDIKYVGMDVLSIEGADVTINDNSLSIFTFKDFVDWVNKYDDGTMYMGWNCSWYDVPQIKYELAKKGLTLPRNCNLLNIKKYQDFPVYDLKERLFSYGYSSSMLLTLEGLKIPYTYFDYNEMFEKNDDDLFMRYITEYVNNIKNIFIKAKGVLI